MKKGFTLIELLAVIVILAIIALIATPIVLSIISDSKESASLRSAEMYLDAVEYGIADTIMNNKTIPNGKYSIIENGNICIGTYSNKTCTGDIIEVEVNGEVPKEGSTITIEEGKIKKINLSYGDKTIIKDSKGNLVYSELGMSTVSAVLEENDWETIQKVVKAGKAAEAGWSVGDTKTLEINDQEKIATIIGLDHDGNNTATFMVMESIGKYAMNNNNYNTGGWKDSTLRTLLNSEIYNSMSNKEQIKEVTKMTNNTGYCGTVATETQDKLFILSVVESGLSSEYDVDGEGTTYEWFKTKKLNRNYFSLRSSYFNSESDFFSYDFGKLYNISGGYANPIFIVFVIG